jgi:hypothetical protein
VYHFTEKKHYIPSGGDVVGDENLQGGKCEEKCGNAVSTLGLRPAQKAGEKKLSPIMVYFRKRGTE